MQCLFLRVLGVNVDNLLDFIVATEEDAGSVVDMLWNDLEHACHVAVNCLTTSCCVLAEIGVRTLEPEVHPLTILEDHGHWSALVQDS